MGRITAVLTAIFDFKVAKQLTIGEETFDPDGPISDRPMSNLEKVHFIVGYAILRPGLRSVLTPTPLFRTLGTPLALSPWPQLSHLLSRHLPLFAPWPGDCTLCLSTADGYCHQVQYLLCINTTQEFLGKQFHYGWGLISGQILVQGPVNKQVLDSLVMYIYMQLDLQELSFI
jgi:hypothetical protein